MDLDVCALPTDSRELRMKTMKNETKMYDLIGSALDHSQRWDASFTLKKCQNAIGTTCKRYSHDSSRCTLNDEVHVTSIDT